MTTPEPPTKLWIILPGGGVRGVFQLGFIDGLLTKHTKNIEIQRVYGTSVGAIMSPLIASCRTDLFRHVIQGIRGPDDVFEPWGWLESAIKLIPLFARMGAYKKVKLVDTVLDTMRTSMSPDEVDSAFSKCQVVAWDVINKKETWFGGKDLPFGMRASSALPMAVPPVDDARGFFADGGIVELYPITKAMEDYKASGSPKDVRLLLINCAQEGPRRLASKPRDILSYVTELMSDSITALATRECQLFDAQNNIQHVCPAHDEFTSAVDIDPAKIARAYHAGTEAGQAYPIA